MKNIAFLSAAILAATATGAMAHSSSARFSEQARWIEEGRQSGAITWTEGIKLRQEQKRLQRIADEMKSGGHFTRHERRKLHRLQDRAERHIAHEMNDRRHRVWWAPRVGY